MLVCMREGVCISSSRLSRGAGPREDGERRTRVERLLSKVSNFQPLARSVMHLVKLLRCTTERIVDAITHFLLIRCKQIPSLNHPTTYVLVLFHPIPPSRSPPAAKPFPPSHPTAQPPRSPRRHLLHRLQGAASPGSRRSVRWAWGCGRDTQASRSAGRSSTPPSGLLRTAHTSACRRCRRGRLRSPQGWGRGRSRSVRRPEGEGAGLRSG